MFESEGAIRMTVFVGIFLIMAGLEAALPRRERTQDRMHRWFTNLGIVVVDTLMLRLLFPILAVGVAELASQKGWGLLGFVDWPSWLEVVIAVVLLDMAIYGQHVASHKIPILWKVHRVHHADRDIDASTGIRFHPIEIALSMLYKFVIIVLLGPTAFAVFLFEVLLNGTAMFNHANFKLPLGFDRVLRMVIVTPDMHRVHHSIIHRETDSNYGFNLSIWDRVFRTYVDQPREGHEGMTIGLKDHQTDGPSSLGWCLLFPFRR